MVALGPSAVPALEGLLRAPSQAVYHHRYLAADALAAIGGPAATAALARALRDSIARSPDPTSLEAEGVIVNRVAAHLGRVSDPAIVELLLEALRTRPYRECALALGRLGERRAVPLLIEYLHDDTVRSAAVEALRSLGDAAVGPLADTLTEALLVHGLEPPSRIDGRVAAARLLGELAPGAQSVPQAKRALRLALHDRQRAVRIEAALALARRAVPEAAADAARVLVAALDEPDWAQVDTILEALARLPALSETLAVPLIAAVPADEAGRRRRLRVVELAGLLRARAAVPALAALAAPTQAHDAPLRLAAVIALEAIPAADAAALERFLDDGEAVVRRRSVEALRRRAGLSPESAVRLLGDPDPAVRGAAAAGLRTAGAAAHAVLRQAICNFGANVRVAGSRWRLWWRACALYVAMRRRAR